MSSTKKLAALFEKNLPLFSALGDATRQQLLLLMIHEWPLSVSELAAKMEISRPTVSHHLKVLLEANILIEHKEGRKIFYAPQLGEYYFTVKEMIDSVDELIKKEGYCTDDGKKST